MDLESLNKNHNVSQIPLSFPFHTSVNLNHLFRLFNTNMDLVSIMHQILGSEKYTHTHCIICFHGVHSLVIKTEIL